MIVDEEYVPGGDAADFETMVLEERSERKQSQIVEGIQKVVKAVHMDEKNLLFFFPLLFY